MFSTAISDDNPELAAARAAGIPVVHRAQALEALMEGRTGLAVAGTHGKSSTSAMLATIFTRIGDDPSYVIGAALAETGERARHGDGMVFIAEADESDRSFLWLHPDVAVITNITDDHPENYAGLADHIDAYAEFTSGIRRTLVINTDDPGARELASRLSGSQTGLRVVTYGTRADADWQVTAIEAAGMSSQATVTTPDGREVTVTLQVPGQHMAHNAVAALAAAAQAGVPAGAAASALGSFRGVRGRLTLLGDQAGIRVLDSFAHHPAAISADLDAARALTGTGCKVIAVYQPRGYARTAAYAPAIAEALRAADVVALLDIYASVGEPIPGVSTQLIAEAGAGQVTSPDQAVTLVSGAARPGDVVLIMGSGPLTALGEQVCAALSARQPALH